MRMEPSFVRHGAVRCWRLPVLLPKSILRAFFLLLSDVLISQPTTDTVEKDFILKDEAGKKKYDIEHF